jgi:hypothetical protein
VSEGTRGKARGQDIVRRGGEAVPDVMRTGVPPVTFV